MNIHQSTFGHGRKHRLLKIAAVLLFLLIGGGLLAVRYYAQPERVAALLTAQAQARLGLELEFRQPARYALWPRLHLELDQVQLRLPGDSSVLLALERLDVSLPWSSLRDSRLVIQQLDLTRPRLELSALQRWLDSPGETATPDLSIHLRIADGALLREGKPLLQGFQFDGDIDALALQDWWQRAVAAAADASPLPPLSGKASVESLQLDGVTLKGLRLETEPAQ